MAHTAARVTANGQPYLIIGNVKETVTDITWSGATASETVTAAELGLNSVVSGSAQITVGVASATGINATFTPSATGGTVGLITATDTAATGQAGTVVRVTARGN